MSTSGDASGRVGALRRCVLAASVVDGVPAVPGDDGVTLEAADDVLVVPWPEVDDVVGALDAEQPAARRRVTAWLRLRAAVAVAPDLSVVARPVGLPRGHVLHPGPDWVREHVLGGALDLGCGAVGLLDDPDQVVVLPPRLLLASGHDDRPWWPRMRRYLEDMGRVAAERHRLDPEGPLRPIGDCDVVTLLGSRYFRIALCARDVVGVRTAAVPMRRRGWLDLSRIDPAFAVAAAAATDPADRGFDRPLLITPDEVTEAPPGGRPRELALMDPVPVGGDRPARPSRGP